MQELQEMQEIIGRNVKARRLELGLSQKKVAEASGVSENSVRRIESGKYDYYFRTLSAIAEALDTSCLNLLQE